LLSSAHRIVVKLGTGVLTDSRRQPDLSQVRQLVAQLAGQRKKGREVVVVSSGAVGAGMGVLGYVKRPGDLADLQACAAVGQSRLMATYSELFGAFGFHVGQVLLTHDDLRDHGRHLNARKTLMTLLKRGVIPIINENDAVSTTELKFGDNDRLSALVTCLLPAQLLVILTSVDGLLENFDGPKPTVIPTVTRIDAPLQALAAGTLSQVSVGGMATKLAAARMVMRAGIPMVIASGRRRDVLERILAAEDEGTLFVPATGKLRGRKRWIAFFHNPEGTLLVDAGARRALLEQGRSLLPPGIIRCEGEFNRGDVVRICDAEGTEFGRGVAEYGAADIRAKTLSRTEIVHRDNLVIL
jgi:glutamate 5-kinase